MPRAYIRTAAALTALILTLSGCRASGENMDIEGKTSEKTTVTEAKTAAETEPVVLPEWTYASNQNYTCEDTRFRMAGDVLYWEDRSLDSKSAETFWLTSEIPLSMWEGYGTFTSRVAKGKVHAFCLDDEGRTLFLAFQRNVEYDPDYGTEYFFYLSEDGGRTWQPRTAPTASGAKDYFSAFDINENGVGCAVIWDYYETEEIYLTRDFAQTWEQIVVPKDPEGYSVLEGHYGAQVHVLQDGTVRLDFQARVGYAHLSTFVSDIWTYEKRADEDSFRLISELPPPAVAPGK